MDLDLGTALGATEGYSNQRLTLYLPDKDKCGQKIKRMAKWINEARELLSQIGGGATAFPPADGNWLNDDGENIWEHTRIIFCYVRPDQFRARLSQLREFLHRFGLATNQGEVVVEFDDQFWRIKDFDEPERGTNG